MCLTGVFALSGVTPVRPGAPCGNRRLVWSTPLKALVRSEMRCCEAPGTPRAGGEALLITEDMYLGVSGTRKTILGLTGQRRHLAFPNGARMKIRSSYRRSALAITTCLAMTCGGLATATIAEASVAPPTLDLRVLLIGDGASDPTTAAWAAALTNEGAPYTEVDATGATATAGTSVATGSWTITLPTLSSGNTGNYDGVVVADSPLYFASGQLSALYSYESNFGLARWTATCTRIPPWAPQTRPAGHWTVPPGRSRPPALPPSLSWPGPFLSPPAPTATRRRRPVAPLTHRS